MECREQGVDLDKLLIIYPEGTKEELEIQLEDPGDLEKLQSMIHAMDFDLPEYWLALNEADKKRYVHEYSSLFERFRSPMPRETVTELLELSASGEVRTHQEIKAINGAQPGFYVSLENGKDVAVDYIINATGQNKRVEVSYLNSPLLNNLLNKRILQPEVSAKCFDYIGYYCTNKAADELVDPNLVVPDDVTKGEIIQNVSAEADEQYNKNWTEFKAACD